MTTTRTQTDLNQSNETREAYFKRFTLEIPIEAVSDCSHIGACDADVEHWALKITRPEQITAEALRAELKEYGAWDSDELADDQANWQRLIWIAAGNIKEENATTITNKTRADLLEAAKTASEWLSRSTRIDDREQAEDLRAAIDRYEAKKDE